MDDAAAVDRRAVHEELERARTTFHRLLDSAGDTDLRRGTEGTRWTNEQLLFHMLFGYVLIRPLLALLRVFGRLPPGAGRAFARVLNAGTGPFDVINYLVPVGGARVLGRSRTGTAFDRVIAWLHRRLDAEREADLRLAMHYPTRWDPLFQDVMTVADLYRYPVRHFDFHRRQLTLADDGRRVRDPAPAGPRPCA
ncbi:DinB family protein [Streptomyces sp. Tu 3180]|uniref:DinB family protein n=1 Tax=Streptomyces sp. Tu 3180 TaxID=2682611 RepID=UPI001358BA2C|nr:DinB family protein [Streptomyces sp. Tu 3180]KAF3463911.1 DinB family protein [Streptomyces sp. Tu 3180]